MCVSGLLLIALLSLSVVGLAGLEPANVGDSWFTVRWGGQFPHQPPNSRRIRTKKPSAVPWDGTTRNTNWTVLGRPILTAEIGIENRGGRTMALVAWAEP